MTILSPINPTAFIQTSDGSKPDQPERSPAIALAPYYPILGPIICAPKRNYEISKAEAKTFTKNKYKATVVNVVDGDTVDVHIPKLGKDYYVRVRYIGMDTPEVHHPKKGLQCYGKEATEQNEKLVKGKTVVLALDAGKVDRYGRLLAYVYAGSGKEKVFVNEWLVGNGFAHVMTVQPNDKYQDVFLKAERHARENKLGFWADGVCD